MTRTPRSTPSPEPPQTYWDVLHSPLGPVVMVVDEQAALVELRLHGAPTGGKPSPARCAPVRTQLEEYFAGRRRTFELALRPRGTDFQRRVWDALCTIPFGSTSSYLEVARRIDRPTATRAVGQANGSNPIPIVIPCHRVIASDGSLGGYSAGLAVKRQLLALEGLQPHAFRLTG